MKKAFGVWGCSAAIMMAAAGSVQAAEGGGSFYLLGSKTIMAGYLPGPGVYFIDSNFIYSGSADISIPTAGGKLTGDIDATAVAIMPTGLWVMDNTVLGGNLAVGLTMPFVYKSLSAEAFLGQSKIGDFSDDNFAPGDPVPGATLGWHNGNLHYSLGALVNVPIGQWDIDNPLNAGFNHWAIDATGAMTYLDPKTGLELSGAAGFTFNFENPDTNYTSGTDFHAEFATMMHLSETFSIGLNGYFYRQVTGDSGSGAKLGDFKGSTNAIGPALSYTFMLGAVPVSTNLQYYHEFETVNRVKGNGGFVTISLPLSMSSAQ